MGNYKFKFIDFFALLVPILLGIASLAMWLTEIRVYIGWEGIEWIRRDLKSVYIITLFIVLSYVLPVVIISKPKWFNSLISIVLLYVFSLISYFVSKWIFKQLYTKMGDETHVVYVWYLILVVTIVAGIFYYLKQFLLFKSEIFHVMTIIAVFISIVPASLITIEWVKGFSVIESFVEAVKMGYPIFWLNVLMGLVSYSMARKII
jgi:hypothetical protein